MEICILGDSVAKGVIYDEAAKKYTFLKSSFVNLFSQGKRIPVKNLARFGCTITKGEKILQRNKEILKNYQYTVLEFGGNDCNYNWQEIAVAPEKEHLPEVLPHVFEETYGKIIETIKAAGSTPVLLTLPPLNSERFFQWVSNGLNKENILKWLGDVNFIYRWHESYNVMVGQIAQKYNVPLIDIRRIFLENRRYGDLLCADGMHPSEKGHALICSALGRLAF